MRAGELWTVVWCERTLFSVRRLDEVLAVNRQKVEARDWPGCLVLVGIGVHVDEMNARRLELEKAQFGHGLCGRKAGTNEDGGA